MGRALEKLIVGMKHVGIARHQRKIFFPSVRVDNARYFIALGRNLGDLGVETNFAPQLFKQLDERTDQGAGAAFGKIDTPLALETMDQRIDRSSGERVAADEQRMKAEKLAQVRIANVFGDHAINRAIGFQPDQL